MPPITIDRLGFLGQTIDNGSSQSFRCNESERPLVSSLRAHTSRQIEGEGLVAIVLLVRRIRRTEKLGARGTANGRQ